MHSDHVTQSTPPTTRPRVLIVENEPAARQLLEAVVRSGGDSARTATTVEEALSALEEDGVSWVFLEPRAPRPVCLVLDGKRKKRRTGLLVNGARCDMQDAWFIVLLRLVAAHLRAVGSWSSRASLGIEYSREMASRIRGAFRGLVPDGFDVIEADGNRSFRLNPAIVVQKMDRQALTMHPDDRVGQIVADCVFPP